MMTDETRPAHSYGDDSFSQATAEIARLRSALREIASYVDVEEMEDAAEEWGLSREEALEMSYDNVLATARRALMQEPLLRAL